MFGYIHIKPVAICTTGISHQDGIVTFSFQSISYYSPPIKPLSSNILQYVVELCVCVYRINLFAGLVPTYKTPFAVPLHSFSNLSFSKNAISRLYSRGRNALSCLQ